jgi:hypothetical protein
MNKRMVQPEHIGPGLAALLKKLEAKREAWKRQQDEDRWIIERAAELDDQFLEVFGDEQNR